MGGGLSGDTGLEEDVEGVLADLWGFAGEGGGGRKVKHDEEMVGPGEGELNVAESAEEEAFAGGQGGGHGIVHGDGEALESLLSDSGKDLFFAGEVAVWGVVADAGAACDFAEGEGAGAYFSDKGDGGREEGGAKIAVMVGLGIGHRVFLPEVC